MPELQEKSLCFNCGIGKCICKDNESTDSEITEIEIFGDAGDTEISDSDSGDFVSIDTFETIENDRASKLQLAYLMQTHFRRSVIKMLLEKEIMSISALSNGTLIISVDMNSLSQEWKYELDKFLKSLEKLLINFKLKFKTINHNCEYEIKKVHDGLASSVSFQISHLTIYQKVLDAILNLKLTYRPRHILEPNEQNYHSYLTPFKMRPSPYKT